MKRTVLSLCLAAVFSAAADNYLSVNFSTGRLPAGCSVENADGAELQKDIYANIQTNESAWVVKRQGDGYGYCAISPTRNEIPAENDAAPAADNRLVFPAVTVDSEEAVVRWEAKSLHGDFAENYRVAARESGSQEWTDIYVCHGENSRWTRHAVCLRDFVDKDVEVAFIATTQRGFILAVDNIKIGVPPTDEFDLVAEQLGPKFFGENDNIEVTIKISNFGDTKRYSEIKLYNLGNLEGSFSLEPDGLKCGESIECTFEITDAPLNSKSEFNVIATTADGSGDIMLLNNVWVYRSHFARTSVIDRCSGTWCPNCPTMGLTTDRLKEIYGDQAIIVEAHVNDNMTSANYWNQYLGSFVYSIPMLVPNHDKNSFVYSLASTDDFSSALCIKTVAEVEATCRVDGNKVTVDATPRFASSVNNTDGRYKLQYMLIGTIHNEENYDYCQQNSSSNYKYNQYYLQPSIIMPEMMYFHNVILDWGDNPVLNVPSTLANDATGLKAIAMVVDTTDGHIVNATIATDKNDSGVDDIIADQADESANNGWYTLQGIRLNERPDAPGIYIHRRRVVKI